MTKSKTVLPARLYYEGPFRGLGTNVVEIMDGDRRPVGEVFQSADSGDDVINLAGEIVKRYNMHAELLEALRYQRYGDTAKLLAKAATLIDASAPDDWNSYFTPHLYRAAAAIQEALDKVEGKS